MSYSAKDLSKILNDHGFEFKRSKGSHHLFQNKQSGKIVVVPFHGNKDLPKGTYFGILKQAGIDKNQIK
ncbi:MAG: type II toxin-antitoxin system HicA family toxin [Bacteroidetes bacterium]|nr:type II toxin-antitoxin system HicA family toxin [Bacteroidota bacterium]MBI3482032.1 type II toxin-antitoxin system HicA family toxin [Bacteroidota bacterium]